MSLKHELSNCLACDDDCGHTTEQHAAFDDGVMAGCDGIDQHANPYQQSDLREAWSTGHAVGALSRNAVG